MSADISPSPSQDEKRALVHPTFWGALRGVWLITWKSQVTWQRLAMSGIGLLALPLLIYLTTSSPEAWAQSHRLDIGSPAAYLSGFSKRATRVGAPLKPEQQAELVKIVTEEFGQAQRDWDEKASEPTVERQRELVQECNERIAQRVEAVLDDRQFTEFKAYQRRHRGQLAAPVGEPGWGRTAPFYHCLIDLYFFIILPLNCIRMCGALIRDELEADTLSFLTTRPLSRARLLLVKFLSQTAWLQIGLLAQTLLLFAAGSVRKMPELSNLLPLFLGAQFLAVLAWSALGLALGQISRRYMALALLYGAIVEMGIGRIPTNINSLSMMRHLQTILGHNAALQNSFHWPTATFSSSIGALLLGAVLFVIFASLMFTYREYHHTTEMQK